MFARIKKSGNNQYIQIVENHRDKGKVKQRVIATLGRLDQMNEKGEVESLVRSLSRFSERTLLILSDKSKVSASAKKIGPALIFERLWRELGIGSILSKIAAERKFGFSLERVLFLTGRQWHTLHRLQERATGQTGRSRPERHRRIAEGKDQESAGITDQQHGIPWFSHHNE